MTPDDLSLSACLAFTLNHCVTAIQMTRVLPVSLKASVWMFFALSSLLSSAHWIPMQLQNYRILWSDTGWWRLLGGIICRDEHAG
jgi:hypothetical protein